MARGSRMLNRVVVEDGAPHCPECGCLLDDARSLPHMGLFFVFIKHLFENWPDDGVDKFFPVDEKHLRKWLLVKAGHVQPYYPLPFNTPREKEFTMRVLNAQMEADRMNGLYGWPQEVENGCLAVLRPISIAIYGENAISEKQFCEVSRDVFDFIYVTFGIDVKEWKETHGKGKR